MCPRSACVRPSMREARKRPNHAPAVLRDTTSVAMRTPSDRSPTVLARLTSSVGGEAVDVRCDANRAELVSPPDLQHREVVALLERQLMRWNALESLEPEKLRVRQRPLIARFKVRLVPFPRLVGIPPLRFRERAPLRRDDARTRLAEPRPANLEKPREQVSERRRARALVEFVLGYFIHVAIVKVGLS